VRRLAPIVFIVAGLAASIASLVDAVGAPAFCSEAGCTTVRSSAWAHPLGIPLPVLGVAFFAAMLLAAFVNRPRLRLGGAIAGAMVSAALIAVQGGVLHAWCELCLVADLAALGHLASVLIVRRSAPIAWRGIAAIGPLVAAGVLALHVVLAPSASITEVAPPADVAGAVTIVEFVDFECPFCRRQAPLLDAAIADAGVAVHVERVMLPLPMHAGARPAAIAWCCAEAQGRGEQMAAALFAASPDNLTTDGCERIAAGVGCELARYRADRDSPATRAHLERDLARAKAVGVRALPTLVIGHELISGASLTESELAAKIRAA
jgi:protein-disulfide isomerase